MPLQRRVESGLPGVNDSRGYEERGPPQAPQCPNPAALLVTVANMLGVEDSEPDPEHQQTTGERKEMDGIEEVQHASGKRQHRECADPPWPFRCPAGEKILERQAEKKAQSEKQAKVH